MTFDRIRPGDHVCWTLDDGDERLEARVGYVRAPRHGGSWPTDNAVAPADNAVADEADEPPARVMALRVAQAPPDGVRPVGCPTALARLLDLVSNQTLPASVMEYR